YVGGDGHDRNRIHISRGDPCHKVRGSRTGSSEADAYFPGSPRVSVRRMGRALFMGSQDMIDLILIFIQSVVHVQDGSARITEDGVHALFFQTFYNNFCTSKLHSVSSLLCLWYLQNRASVAGRHHSRISCQISGGHLRLARLPFCFSRLHFLIGDFYFQLQIRDVDTDDIAFFNKGDRTAHRCLRRNVSYGRSPGSAAETSVCDQGDGGAQSHAGNGGCGVQHLSHSRTAFRSFVTDHDHVAFHDLSAFDRRDGVFFTVEDSRRSFVYHHLLHNGGTLHNAAIRSQIAFQH